MDTSSCKPLTEMNLSERVTCLQRLDVSDDQILDALLDPADPDLGLFTQRAVAARASTKRYCMNTRDEAHGDPMGCFLEAHHDRPCIWQRFIALPTQHPLNPNPKEASDA